MNVSCACVPCAYSHERACASTSRVRAWPSRVRVHERALHCRLVYVRGDISCACAAVVCVRSRACVRVNVSCVCARRVRVVMSMRAS